MSIMCLCPRCYRPQAVASMDDIWKPCQACTAKSAPHHKGLTTAEAKRIIADSTARRRTEKAQLAQRSA